MTPIFDCKAGQGRSQRNHLFESPRVSYVIFASPKSGTQWMQQLLSSHPDVQCAEARVFGDYFDPGNVTGVNITLETYVSILSKYHRAPVAPEQADDYFRRLLFNLLDTIVQTSLSAAGKSIYGEKITPLLGTASAIVERLAEYNPELRFVHLSRDGRDVVVSGLVHQQIIHSRDGSANGRVLREAVAEGWVPEDMLEFFASLWKESVSAALAARARFGHYLRLRYEDLLEDTLGQAQRLLEFIGADASDDIVNRCVEAASFERMSGGRRRGAEDRLSVVRKGTSGDWRRWFTDEQAAWFDQRAGELLGQLGYQRVAAVTAWCFKPPPGSGALPRQC